MSTNHFLVGIQFFFLPTEKEQMWDIRSINFGGLSRVQAIKDIVESGRVKSCPPFKMKGGCGDAVSEMRVVAR